MKAARKRRVLLKGAGMAAAALSPTVLAQGRSSASSRRAAAPKPIVWRCQAAWSLDDDFGLYLNSLARTLEDLTNGQLLLEVLKAGTVVSADRLSEAVSEGLLDACHRMPSSEAGSAPAFGLWGNGPAFGMDGRTLLSWHYHGGGEELLAELYAAAGLNVHSMLYGSMPTQALGWFRRPLARVEDLEGMRIRVGGMAGLLYEELGASVVELPPEAIVSALKREEIDAAEFSSISSDRALGLPDVLKVCMLQSFHQCAEQVELLINRDRYEALTPDLKSKLFLATRAVSTEMGLTRANDNSMHYIEMRELQGVRFYKTPESVLRAQLAAWDRVSARYSSVDPMFARVADSMRRYAQRCVGWQNDTWVDQRMAYNHYFAQRVPMAS